MNGIFDSKSLNLKEARREAEKYHPLDLARDRVLRFTESGVEDV